METILGIDLGTTNSEVAVIHNGKVEVLREDGQAILPSVVGLDAEGHLLVGAPARNQAVLAPERTIRSIKRRMGEAETVRLGDQEYTPQEVSAFILRKYILDAVKREFTFPDPVAVTAHNSPEITPGINVPLEGITTEGDVTEISFTVRHLNRNDYCTVRDNLH